MFDFNQNIPVGCDHAGVELKTWLKQQLSSEGYRFFDFGTNTTDSVDYPDYIHPLADAINRGIYQRGIILCGSGNGVAMVANKYPLVRAAICWTEEIAKLARLHNDANIIALPARFISQEEALKIVKIFFTTDFEGGRHERRVQKISPPVR
jgi:ribose 5-phosphate isomerase B